MLMNRMLLVLTGLWPILLLSQNTVGLISYDPPLTYDGYNLIYPHNQPNVYLLDNCGEIVKVWEDDPGFRPGNTAYLLPDGRVVKTKRPASVVGNPIWAGGGGGTVEIRDWNNNLEWSFTLNDSLARLHHDIEPMPNGNILMIVWEVKTAEEAIQAGRDPATIDNQELWPDYIIEVNPGTDEIVWEWHAWDHLIQDFDNTKDNFGVVADHPELININFDNNGVADWLHANAIDYHPDIDQILLCVPFFNEIWIIDHSTSTTQAAGKTGASATGEATCCIVGVTRRPMTGVRWRTNNCLTITTLTGFAIFWIFPILISIRLAFSITRPVRISRRSMSFLPSGICIRGFIPSRRVPGNPVILTRPLLIPSPPPYTQPDFPAYSGSPMGIP